MAEIELGNGLPDVRTTEETVESLKKAGFEIVESGGGGWGGLKWLEGWGV